MRPKRPHPQLTHQLPCASRYRAPYFEKLNNAIVSGLIFDVNQSGGSIGMSSSQLWITAYSKARSSETGCIVCESVMAGIFPLCFSFRIRFQVAATDPSNLREVILGAGWSVWWDRSSVVTRTATQFPSTNRSEAISKCSPYSATRLPAMYPRSLSFSQLLDGVWLVLLVPSKIEKCDNCHLGVRSRCDYHARSSSVRGNVVRPDSGVNISYEVH